MLENIGQSYPVGPCRRVYSAIGSNRACLVHEYLVSNSSHRRPSYIGTLATAHLKLAVAALSPRVSNLFLNFVFWLSDKGGEKTIEIKAMGRK